MGIIYSTESNQIDTSEADTEDVVIHPAFLNENRNIVETIKPFFESILANHVYDPSKIIVIHNKKIFFPGDHKSPMFGETTKTSGLIRDLFLTKPEIVIFVAENLGINLDTSMYEHREFIQSNPEQ